MDRKKRITANNPKRNKKKSTHGEGSVLHGQHRNILEQYTAWLTFKGYKPSGIEGKKASARVFLEYAQAQDTDIQSMTHEDAEGYKEYLRLRVDARGGPHYKTASINRIIGNLKSFTAFLCGSGQAYTNSFASVGLMKTGEHLPRTVLSIEQMKILLQGIEVTDRDSFTFKLMVELLYVTGCRISELRNMRVQDFDLKQNIVLLREDKTSQERYAVLTGYSVEMVKLHIRFFRKQGALFPFKNPRSITWWTGHRFEQVAKKVGLPHISAQSIRHTIATQLLRKGADIREVQEILGHKNIRSTERYTRLFPEDLRAVVESSHPRERKQERKE